MTGTASEWKSMRTTDFEVRTERKASLRTRIWRWVLALGFTAWLALGGVGIYHLDGLNGGIQGRPVMIICGVITAGVMYFFYYYLAWRRR